MRCARVYGRAHARSIGGFRPFLELAPGACSLLHCGQRRSPLMPIVNRIADLQAEITAWRHDLHAHPELLYDVQRTAGSVAEKLKAFGCDEVVPGLGRTGVVGVIHGRKGKSNKVIGLRADMDALPIEEATDLPYKSTVPGKMHACGHDGHTAMLLGAARYLAETRNFAGTAVVIFQPAEEGGAGGKAMLDDGMMESFGINEVYGMHNYPGTPRARNFPSIPFWWARRSSITSSRWCRATSIRWRRRWCRSACSRPAIPTTSFRRPPSCAAPRAVSRPRCRICWRSGCARW